MATGCFDVQKNDFGEKSSLFVAVLSEMGVDNIDTRVAQGFVRTAMKYEVKNLVINFSPCARVIVKLTSRIDLELYKY